MHSVFMNPSSKEFLCKGLGNFKFKSILIVYNSWNEERKIGLSAKPQWMQRVADRILFSKSYLNQLNQMTMGHIQYAND